MTTQYDEQLSAFVDGELEQADAEQLVSEILRDDELRSRWLRYQQSGNILRREDVTAPSVELLAGIHAKLNDEPTILAPRQSHPMSATFKQVAGMAIAATIAAVAVLMIQPAENVFNASTNQIAATTSTPAANQQWLRVKDVNWSNNRPAVVSKLNSYLVNHNGYSTSIRGTLPFASIVSAGNDANLANDEDAAIEYKPAGDSAQK